jgi:hypothetical protein
VALVGAIKLSHAAGHKGTIPAHPIERRYGLPDAPLGRLPAAENAALIERETKADQYDD